MKVGIVGSGLIVDTLFEFIKDLKQIEIMAITATARSIDKLNKLAKEHNIEYVYTDYQQFLENDQYDTVYLGVPNHLHYRMAKQALSAGKNVIVEKPFTSNYNQAKMLEKIAKERKLIILEAISNQHNPNYHKIKELLPTIGDVKIVVLNYTQYSSRYDAFKEGVILPAFDYRKSGGALMDLNVYNVHYLVGLFGKPDEVKYYPNIEYNIDTSGILMLSYDSFKAVLIAAKDCGSPLLNCIEGNKGCIYTSSPLFTLTHFHYQLNKEEPVYYDLCDNAHRMQHEFITFAEIIDNKDYDKAYKLLKHSIDVMEVLTKARASADIVFPDDEVI
ncbi:MAG: Gfo/Idh/MocA family protein [Erysipelotrichaceae bacterium]|jgi:predicted dehydrogenase